MTQMDFATFRGNSGPMQRSDKPEPTPEGLLIKAGRGDESVRSAARRAGLSEGRWRQIENGYQSVTAGVIVRTIGPPDTVAQMAFTVGVTSSELVKAGRSDAAYELELIQSLPIDDSPPPASPVVKPIDNASQKLFNQFSDVSSFAETCRALGASGEVVDAFLNYGLAALTSAVASFSNSHPVMQYDEIDSQSTIIYRDEHDGRAELRIPMANPNPFVRPSASTDVSDDNEAQNGAADGPPSQAEMTTAARARNPQTPLQAEPDDNQDTGSDEPA